jgi:hypothetical protein
MSIYFRVFKDADDPVGTLYNRQFKVTTGATTHSDLVISSSAEHFAKISEANPRNIILRVHEDKRNQNAAEGRYYDENFESVDFSKPVTATGGLVILTITPDEFDAMKLVKK